MAAATQEATRSDPCLETNTACLQCDQRLEADTMQLQFLIAHDYTTLHLPPAKNGENRGCRLLSHTPVVVRELALRGYRPALVVITLLFQRRVTD